MLAPPSVMMRQVRRRKTGFRVLIAIPFLVLVAYSPITWSIWRSPLFRTASDNVGPGQCFSPARVNATAPCAQCVHFVTCAVNADRWGSVRKLAQGLHVTAAAIRASQKCFTLYAYTNVPRGSAAWNSLAEAGGDNVKIVEYPTDLPKNAWSGRNQWIELSRRKLDLLERYEKLHGRKAIWTDLDTIVVADMSCAYARAPHFIVSRNKRLRPLWERGWKLVWLHKRRSAFGDLFMLDAKLIQQIRDLENSGMPPPTLDLQDYFSYLLNRCDGSVVDLRALMRKDGFMRGDGMCFEFDFVQGLHPSQMFLNSRCLTVGCTAELNGTIA